MTASQQGLSFHYSSRCMGITSKILTSRHQLHLKQYLWWAAMMTYKFQSILMGSKYMKAAQQLLDEVASVGEDFKTDSNVGSKGQLKGSGDSPVAEAFNGVKSMENGRRRSRQRRDRSFK
ncbi:hypothetical protein MRB53_030590 [Persea americana]|uniref:Uncharacterized protein n=1 Tax=Persea americana TaxID=3435 RepID=A0ACC2KLM4_PERAE|nr:hypothetical protein MRB53_030590 [Persea americana]